MGRVLISAQRLHLDTAFASERGVFFYGRRFWHEAHRRASRPTLQRGSDVLRARERCHCHGKACTGAPRGPGRA
ncbi:hypothetical protein XFF6992_470059 [Xanthomonas citri pv. fuscans]|nr:hypothetical protein XFF6992_470059 [Xanthomonas citri pv. fuscans]SOO34915.1 hypothetical protein XFF6994_4820002 [Xanthomonas citri pv. fuscans]